MEKPKTELFSDFRGRVARSLITGAVAGSAAVGMMGCATNGASQGSGASHGEKGCGGEKSCAA